MTMIRMWCSILASNFADGMRGKGIAQTGLMYLISVSVLSILGALLWSFGGQSFFLRWIVVAGFAQLLCELTICWWIGYLIPEFRVFSAELFDMLRTQVRSSNLHRAQAAKYRAMYAGFRLRLAEEIPEMDQLLLAYDNTMATLVEFEEARSRVVSAWSGLADSLSHQKLELSIAVTRSDGVSLLKELTGFVVLADNMTSQTLHISTLIDALYAKLSNALYSKEFDKLRRQLPGLAKNTEHEVALARTSMSMLRNFGSSTYVTE